MEYKGYLIDKVKYYADASVATVPIGSNRYDAVGVYKVDNEGLAMWVQDFKTVSKAKSFINFLIKQENKEVK